MIFTGVEVIDFDFVDFLEILEFQFYGMLQTLNDLLLYDLHLLQQITCEVLVGGLQQLLPAGRLNLLGWKQRQELLEADTVFPDFPETVSRVFIGEE
jgi:hypothetical protein